MYRYWPKGKGLDVNEDGKDDSADAKATVEEVNVEKSRLIPKGDIVYPYS